MDNLILWVALFVFLGSVLSVLTAGLYLLLPDNIRNKSVDHLISFAVGVLLSTAFLHLIPEALEDGRVGSEPLMLTLLITILLFFILEKSLIWRHHHAHEHTKEDTPDASAPVILMGDSFHNFLDGILITTAFLADFKLGVLTAVAVIAHEIPQELGDFAILIRAGYSRMKALGLNVLSSGAMFLGAGATFLLGGIVEAYTPFLLVIAASSFIYVAMSDLIPAMNRKSGTKELILQIIFIAVGVVFVSWHQIH